MQVVERLVVDVGDQVARALPALDVAGRVAPGGAGQLALALEELQVDRRGVELVLLEHRLGRAELGADVVAGHEDLLRSSHGRVAVAGRDHEAVDAERRSGRRTARRSRPCRFPCRPSCWCRPGSRPPWRP